MGRYDELSGIVSPNIARTCQRVGQHPEHPVTVVFINAGQRREQPHNRVRPPCQQAYEHLIVGHTFLLRSTHYKDSESPMDPGRQKGPTGGADPLGLKSTVAKDL